MSKYWSTTTSALTPYIPGEQPIEGSMVKLNTNENPYPPSERVLEAIRRAADSKLRLYPDPHGSRLAAEIAGRFGLSQQHIFLGNGSDEILAFAFQAFFDRGLPVLFPDVTYSFYSVYANLYGLSHAPVPLDEQFRIKTGAYSIPNSGIILPNPNAPTAVCLPLEDIRRLLAQHTEHVLIVDEAYIDFGGESAVPLIADYPNLLVIHTLSKSRSLAGLRVGYALGQPELIEGLNRVKNSFNSYTLDRLALAGAEASFQDEAHLRETTARIIRTRETAKMQLAGLGFQMTDSTANFLFVTHPAVAAAVLFRRLREHGILVRYFDKPRIDNHLRITVGTDAEMRLLLEALKEILQAEK
ncbi:histidinol-phosphate transaminase [Paenibacillus sp. S150]|uniref:histidinol-phosphate transaminase n=1 Tax=Paenibacillus sp. S150 TaxID=2749826 RepID=UPI001C58F2B6|nr:histidinol-phosphate transaminase [Paenibacillus sp. S150]MBW4081091.1 histidinol-phosphate transaminase [Paenibacillus sp. S150]